MDSKSYSSKEKTAGSCQNSLSQFWQSLIATSISIVLTFGTAAVMDYYKKESAKKEMVMMIIYDFDKTIESMEENDTAFNDAMLNQADLAVHPEHFDSLRYTFVPAMTIVSSLFPETTEKIFSSNIETFNTISNVNFISEVSDFYSVRQLYKKQVLDEFKKDIEGKNIVSSMGSLFSVDFSGYTMLNRAYLNSMRTSRDKCMKIMDISEEDMLAFRTQRIEEEEELDSEVADFKWIQEIDSLETVINKAREKYQNSNDEQDKLTN